MSNIKKVTWGSNPALTAEIVDVNGSALPGRDDIALKFAEPFICDVPRKWKLKVGKQVSVRLEIKAIETM